MIQLNDAVMLEIEKVSEVSQYLWQREWAERNGGNISVDVTDLFDEIPQVDVQEKALPMQLPIESANRIYYVKVLVSVSVNYVILPTRVACLKSTQQLTATKFFGVVKRVRISHRPLSSSATSRSWLIKSKQALTTDQ